MRLLLPTLLSLAMTTSLFAGLPIIMGHRGASHDAPENTVAAFKLGWAQGADACELDVYLSKDGEAVVLHDATTKRTTGVDRKVSEMTVEELQQLDAGSWKDPKYQGEKIPTLAEMLATVPPGKKVVIEVKDKEPVLPAIQKAVAASKLTKDQIIIFGFKYDVMKAARPLFPDAQIYWLSSYKEDKKTGRIPTIEELAGQARTAGFDGLGLHFDFPVDRHAVTYLQSAGLKLMVWTVNKPEIARKLVEAGVYGIGTDRPGWMREQLQ